MIIKPSSLGDIIQALPALSALRRTFPAARISWLVRPEFAPLLEHHPHLTQIIPFDRRLLGKAWYHPKAFAALISLIMRLRRSRFDAVFDFQGLFRTAGLGWLSGCKKRFGMAGTREPVHFFYTKRIPQDRSTIHLVDYYLRMTAEAGVCDLDVEFILPHSPWAADSVKKLLAQDAVVGDYAVFVPGSAHQDKCWPPDRFAALADRLSSDLGLSVVATGTSSESAVVERLKDLAAVGVVNLAGRTTLAELMAMLRSASLVVSNDTGPGHIAAALGRPVVLIFGRSNPARVAPYGKKHSVVAVEPDGRGFKADSTDPKHCIANITVDQVYQTLCQRLKDADLTE